MTGDRQVLLVVHTGRDEATETARRVEKVLGENGIGLRVLAAEQVDHPPLHTHAEIANTIGSEIQIVDADERARMLGNLPLPIRVLLRTVGAWQFKRYVKRLRGA